MTGIMIGFTRARHLLGTIYGDGTLTAVDTEINAAGPNGGGSGNSTINLPSLPSALQAITINNTGTGTVTVSGNGNNIGGSATTTIAAGTSKWFAWGGYSWGFVFGGSCETVTLPVTKDFGTTTQGPAGTPYTVPENTITYETIGYTPCGGLLRKIITTTYSGYGGEVTYYKGTMFSTYTTEGHYTTKLAAAQAAYLLTLYLSCATKAPGTYVWRTFVSVNETTNRIYYHQWADNSPYDCSMAPTDFGIPEDATCYVFTDGIGNEYYLDTQIVWTYEII